MAPFRARTSFESWRSETCWAGDPTKLEAQVVGGRGTSCGLQTSGLICGPTFCRNADLVVPKLWLLSISKPHKPAETEISISPCPAALRLYVVLPAAGAGGRRGDQQHDGGAIRRNRSHQTAIWRL